MSALDEPSEIGALQQKGRSLLNGLNGLVRLKASSPDALEKLERVIATLPDNATVVSTLDEIREKSDHLLKEARAARSEKFKRIEADFVTEARRQGEPVKELESGWRVGEFEIQLRREQARIRIMYNREPLQDWSPIGSREHFDALITKARAKLEKAALGNNQLIDLLWTNYQALSAAPGKTGTRVRLIDIYRAVREQLSQRGGNPDSLRQNPALSKWAFLYNLDRYRRLGSSVPSQRRLVFETGSQRETARSGMVLNGLDASDDYRVFCWALSSS